MAKMYKGSWRRILDLPPIDWALLAAERARGKRHTPASIKKISAAKRKLDKARRKRGMANVVAAAKPIRQAGLPGTVNALARLVGAMAPGQWYGRADIQILSGLKRGTVAGMIIKGEREGLIERTKNPAWVRPGGLECEFLYRVVERLVACGALNPKMQHEVGDQRDGAGTAE